MGFALSEYEPRGIHGPVIPKPEAKVYLVRTVSPQVDGGILLGAPMVVVEDHGATYLPTPPPGITSHAFVTGPSDKLGETDRCYILGPDGSARGFDRYSHPDAKNVVFFRPLESPPGSRPTDLWQRVANAVSLPK